MMIMVDDDRLPLKPGEKPEMRRVRFRTLGCYPLTGAVESNATTLPEIIQEMLLTKASERQGRLIDHDQVGVDGEEEEGRIFLIAGIMIADLGVGAGISRGVSEVTTAESSVEATAIRATNAVGSPISTWPRAMTAYGFVNRHSRSKTIQLELVARGRLHRYRRMR